MRRVLFIVLFPLVFSVKVFGTDGNELLRTCSVVEKTELKGTDILFQERCYGYIEGVIDANAVWHTMLAHGRNHPYDRMKICLPEGHSLPFSQLARIILKYLKGHPEDLDMNASALVYNALHGAFRCV